MSSILWKFILSGGVTMIVLFMIWFAVEFQERD